MRIIDEDAYAAELWKLRENYQMLDDTHTADKIMHGIFRAEQALKEQPTVDAVPVVRCMECKYMRESVDGLFKSGYFCERCHITSDMENCDDFYCADGEMRTDEQ